jgi:hypothetical protein
MKEQVEKLAELLASDVGSEKSLGRVMLAQMEDVLNSTKFKVGTFYRLHYLIVSTHKLRDHSLTLGIGVGTTEARYNGRTMSPISGKYTPVFNTTVSGVIAAEELWT